jgi:hydroxypyruvate reductase
VKGGKLGQACLPARVVTLAISDVPGDDPAIIASGPTVADKSQPSDALDIALRYGISLPKNILGKLQMGKTETLHSDNENLKNSEFQLIATPQMALEQAAKLSKKLGIKPLILSDRVEGESREVAKVMASIALQVRKRNEPFSVPCVLLSGGETTVTIRGKGSGGPNVEFLLALALALEGEQNIYAIACDTDGVDGKEKIAGAIVEPQTLSKAKALGIKPRSILEDNNAHHFFQLLKDNIITGPTLTNVNDFRAVLVL